MTNRPVRLAPGALMALGALAFVAAVGGASAFRTDTVERTAGTTAGRTPPSAVPQTAAPATTRTVATPAVPPPTVAVPTSVSTVRPAGAPTQATTTTRAPACDPAKLAQPPDNGTELDWGDDHGRGTLEIRNGLNFDATVKLVTTEDPPTIVRHVVVRSGNQVALGNIPPGTYRVLFSRGRGWDETRGVFACDRQAREFEETMTFSETYEGRTFRYSTWSMTLHGVVGGTAETTTIDVGAFDRIGKG